MQQDYTGDTKSQDPQYLNLFFAIKMFDKFNSSEASGLFFCCRKNNNVVFQCLLM